MIITSHMQIIIQIYPGLLKLSHKQDNSQNQWFFNQKLRFSPKTLPSNISMLEPIQENDNYKPDAKHYSNLSMFTKVVA
jgi:hypothetical protein